MEGGGERRVDGSISECVDMQIEFKENNIYFSYFVCSLFAVVYFVLCVISIIILFKFRKERIGGD